MRFLREIFLEPRLFYLLGIIASLFAISFALPFFFLVAVLVFVLVFLVLIIEALLLFKHKSPILASRNIGKILSLGDDNIVEINVASKYNH